MHIWLIEYKTLVAHNAAAQQLEVEASRIIPYNLCTEVFGMCDVNRYNDIYNEIKKLTKEDTTQLILEAPTEEEKDFYAMVGDFFLQKKQEECIAQNVF